jgi:RNA polymerase-binding transcription factor DksA
MLSKEEINSYKNLLEKERAILEDELKSVGKQDPNNPADWVVRAPTDNEMSVDGADRSEAGDKMETLGENAGILNELEIRYNNVLRALGKIEAGTYGICEISKEPIEKARLDANPAARTCKAHLENEDSLER